MPYMNMEELSVRTGWTKKNIIKRECLGLPMPPSFKLPRSKTRMYNRAEFFAWLEMHEKQQAANDERLCDINTELAKAKDVQKKKGRPRRPVNWDQLDELLKAA